MKKKLKILIANPAGNITIFVLTYVPRDEYQKIAKVLLNMEDFEGEQVAFVVDKNRMEMCGMEFCGNASRSFALIKALKENISNYTHIDVSVSGCDEILSVGVDPSKNYTQIKMPLPTNVFTLKDTDIDDLEDGTLVDFGGIIHVVVKDKTPSLENFNRMRDYINNKYNPPAMGIMFYDTKHSFLTPVVYVKDVDTTYFEGSCASGSTAVAIAFSDSQSDGTFHFTLPQPSGTITSTIERENHKIKAIYIEGPVALSDEIDMEIEI